MHMVVDSELLLKSLICATGMPALSKVPYDEPVCKAQDLPVKRLIATAGDHCVHLRNLP